MSDNEISQPASVTATTGSADASPAASVSVTPSVETPSTPTAAPEGATLSPASTEISKPDAVSSVLGDESAANPAAGKTDANDTTKPEINAESKTDAANAATATEAKTEVVLPTYESFKLPEGFVSDKDSLGVFSKLLGEIETGKLDHAAMQEKGQALVDLGVKAVNESITKLNDFYVQIHEKQKTDWFDAFKADPEIGGEKVETTVKAVREAIDGFGGTKEQIAELRTQMKESGYGNYPALIRLINNMQSKINSYTKETKQPVVPGAKPAPNRVKPYQAFYQGAQG